MCVNGGGLVSTCVGGGGWTSRAEPPRTTLYGPSSTPPSPEHRIQLRRHDLKPLYGLIQVDEAVPDDGQQPVVPQHLLAEHLVEGLLVPAHMTHMGHMGHVRERGNTVMELKQGPDTVDSMENIGPADS